VFFLVPAGKGVYGFPGRQDIIPSTGAPELKEVRAIASALANAPKNLTSKKPAERTSAALLLVRRWQPGSPEATIPIPAVQSKALLEAIGTADWRAGGAQAFARLGLSEKHGWKPPAKLEDVPAAARKWLTENAARLKMKRVPRDEAPGEEPGAGKGG
jgi:hypothetical protein